MNNNISIIRFISMIMIISCHILQGLGSRWAFWVNVGVQIFLIISGYLYGSKDIKDVKKFYLSRLKKILIPYSILAVIIFVVEKIFLKTQYSILLMIGSILGFGGFYGNSSILTHTWFVSYILICYLLIPVFQKIFTSKTFKENFLKFIFVIIFIQMLEIFSVINIKACWINTFIFGYFYNRCCKNKTIQRNMKILSIICFIVIIPFAIIYQEKLNVILPNFLNVYSIYFVNYGHVFLGSLLFIIFYKILTLFKFKNNSIFKFSDKYSYYIYLVHQIFILKSFSVLFLTEYLYINIFLIILLSILFGIILKFITDSLLKVLKL